MKIPLGADKTRSASYAVFSVYSNDNNNNHDTNRSALEFAINQEQPEVCSFIRLGVTLFQSEDWKKRVAKTV